MLFIVSIFNEYNQGRRNQYTGGLTSFSRSCFLVGKYTKNTSLFIRYTFRSLSIMACFFTLGIYLAKYKRYLASIKCIVLLILSLFIAVAETLYLHECYGGGLGTKPSSFLVAISIILLLFNEKIKYWYDKHIKHAAVTYISKMSFIIYLTHYYIIIVLSQFCQIDHWIVQWSIVVFTDLLIITIIDRILPQKLKPFVGIY